MVIVAKRIRRSTVFGARLRSLREAAGLSQTQLGEKVGMAYQSIAKFERGAVEPTWPTVLILAEALGVKCDAFNSSEEHDQPEEKKPRKK